MNEKIIDRMTNIVADIMKCFQSDFTKYDKPYIEAADDSKFPMLWIVAESHTYLLRLGEYEEFFNNEEAARYAYAQGKDPFTCYLNLSDGDKIFLITKNEITETTVKAAHEIIRDIITPVVEKWKEQNGALPNNFKVPILFRNITLSQLKEIFRAEEGRDGNTLLNTLRNLRNYRRFADNHYLELSYDSGYKKFVFAEYINSKQGLVGGIVFHGWPDTGYQQNYAVQLTPTYGWSTHT